MTEDVLKALDNAGKLTQTPTSNAAIGSAAEGRLSITLSRSGLTGTRLPRLLDGGNDWWVWSPYSNHTHRYSP